MPCAAKPSKVLPGETTPLKPRVIPDKAWLSAPLRSETKLRVDGAPSWGKAKQGDQRQGEGEQDDESRDLREGFAAVDVTSAEQTASQMTLVVQSLVPIEEHVTLLLGRSSPGGSPSWVDFERAGTPLAV